MAKAGGKVTTWIRYSRAKKLIGDYLGWDAKSVDRELLKRLEAREIQWQCGRFEAPKEYSGPGPGDPEFFLWEFPKSPNELIPDYGNPIGAVHIIGDTATRSGGAIADDMEVAYEDTVRLKLLPPASSPPAKKTRRSSPVDIVVAEKFPDGPWPNLTPKENVNELVGELKRRKIRIPSTDTLKRKLGLKKY
jgi:hypothetical protein